MSPTNTHPTLVSSCTSTHDPPARENGDESGSEATQLPRFYSIDTARDSSLLCGVDLPAHPRLRVNVQRSACLERHVTIIVQYDSMPYGNTPGSFPLLCLAGSVTTLASGPHLASSPPAHSDRPGTEQPPHDHPPRSAASARRYTWYSPIPTPAYSTWLLRVLEAEGDVL